MCTRTPDGNTWVQLSDQTADAEQHIQTPGEFLGFEPGDDLFKENRVYVELGGGCQGCGMANVTLKQGIETAIKKQLPEIVEILDVTDHAGGDNPYYQPSKK